VSPADAQLGESPVSGVEPRRRVTKDVGQSTLSVQSATSEGGDERLRRDISGGALRSGDRRAVGDVPREPEAGQYRRTT